MRRNIAGFAFALLIAAICLPEAADAACFSLSVPGGAVTIAYNPLDNTAATQSVPISLNNDTCGSASVVKIGVSNVPRDSAGNPIGSPVQPGYFVTAQNTNVGGIGTVSFNRSTPDIGTESMGAIVANQIVTSNWFLNIPAHSVVPFAGRDFTMYVVGEVNGTWTYIPVSVHVDVATVTQLSFAGAATTLTMDFGELASNASQNINVLAQATVPFDIVWTSQNGGVLKNLSDSSWSIPYTATLNGAAVSNSTLYTDLTAGGTQGASTSLPVSVTVGDVSNKRAGTYQDIVTITIQPH